MIAAQQLQGELKRFREVIATHQPKVVLEIGAGQCGLAVSMLALMDPGSLLVSVDLPEADGGTLAEYESAARKMIAPDRKFSLLRGRSESPETFTAVVGELFGREVDLLFVDGEHTQAAATRDYETYYRLLAQNGLACFHDILMPELWPMWNRLRGARPPTKSLEIIENPGQWGCGIGILIGR